MQRTDAWFQREHDLSYAEDRGMVPGGAYLSDAKEKGMVPRGA